MSYVVGRFFRCERNQARVYAGHTTYHTLSIKSFLTETSFKTVLEILIVTSCFSLVYRCACFDGPACPSSLCNPCQPYKLPPPVPAKFTLYYNGKRTDCSPTGCNETHFSGRELQTLIEQKKKRDDSYDDYWSSYFYLPGNESDFILVKNFSLSCMIVEGLSGAAFKAGSATVIDKSVNERSGLIAAGD